MITQIKIDRLSIIIVVALALVQIHSGKASEPLELKSDVKVKHSWSNDPTHIDHGFIHHTELFDALRKDKTSFEAFDVFHVKGDGEKPHPFLNLGDLHKDMSKLYDTKTTYVFDNQNYYLDLDHASVRVSSIGDNSMHICHDDIEKVQIGTYLVGSGEAEWVNEDHVTKWISNTDHVGPRIKRKLADNSLTSLGLLISRHVKYMEKIENSKCADLTTETIHPNSMFETLTVDSFFHAYSANEASKFNREHGLEESMNYEKRASRRLDFLVDGNGVQYCDDTVEKLQKPYMTHPYNKWNYGSRGFGWYKGSYNVPSQSGGGEIMYLASLLSNSGSGCFMYMNDLTAFNWNADVTDVLSPKAATSPYILSGTSESGILCKNCFAFLGARVRVVAEFQKKNSEVRFLAFVGGTSAAFAEVQVNNYAGSFSKSGTFVYPQPESAYKDVAIGNTGIKFYWKGGGYGYELSGEVEMQGQVRSSAGIYADAYIFAAYGGKGGSGETFYVDKSASIDYYPPSLVTSSDFNVKKASLKTLLTGSVNMKIGRSLKVLGKELGVTADFTTSIRKQITLSYGGTKPVPLSSDDDAAPSPASDDDAPASDDATAPENAKPVVFASIILDNTASSPDKRALHDSITKYHPGDKIMIEYKYTGISPISEHEVFISLVTEGQGETPVMRKSFTVSKSGSGRVSIEFLVPWNRNFQGGEGFCHFILRPSFDDKLVARTELFSLEAYTERDSIFTAPESLVSGKHDEELRAGTLYTVHWNKDLLWEYRQEPHQQRHGEQWQAEQVTFELVGERFSAGKVVERTHFNEFGIQPNAGYATITFPPQAVSVTKGHRFYLLIKAIGASYLQGWSSGYFRFYQGSDETSGIPLVSIQTMGVDSAFRLSSKHKVEYSRSFISPQDFAASRVTVERLDTQRKLQVGPVKPVDDGAQGCQGLITSDMNYAMAGKAGLSSLVGNIDFTSSMLSAPLGQERSECVTDLASTATSGSDIPPTDPVTLDPDSIPTHDSVEPVSAPDLEPPPESIPSPPNATELRGWLVTKIYSDCSIATSDPGNGQIMMKVEAVGACVKVGESDQSGKSVYLLNDVVPDSSEARTWFFSGPNGAHCTEDALMKDDSGQIMYQSTYISLGECTKLGGSSQLHFAITTYETNTTSSPTADFGSGTGTVYWDVHQNCGTGDRITSYTITNPSQCYTVQSMSSLDSRQMTCSSTGENITSYTYYSDTQCTSGSNKAVRSGRFMKCAVVDYHHTSMFGQTGYLPTADNYKSNFCADRLPYTTKKENGKSGSSGGIIRDNSMSGGAIAGIVVMVLTLLFCIAMTVHYTKQKKNPFNLWGNDDHDPTLRNILNGRRPSATRPSESSMSGIATHDATRESTLTMDKAYPENHHLSTTEGTDNPMLNGLSDEERQRITTCDEVPSSSQRKIPRKSLLPAAGTSSESPQDAHTKVDEQEMSGDQTSAEV